LARGMRRAAAVVFDRQQALLRKDVQSINYRPSLGSAWPSTTRTSDRRAACDRIDRDRRAVLRTSKSVAADRPVHVPNARVVIRILRDESACRRNAHWIYSSIAYAKNSLCSSTTLAATSNMEGLEAIEPYLTRTREQRFRRATVEVDRGAATPFAGETRRTD